MAEKFFTTGAPLDLSTKPTFPKPVGIVEMAGYDDLTLADLRLFDTLLANAYKTVDQDVMHSIRLSDLRGMAAADGAVPHRGNERLRSSVKRLKKVVMEFNVLGSDRSDWTHITNLLGDVAISQNGDVLSYEFPRALRPLLVDPALHARIHLDVIYRFKSKYSLVLYEILQRHANRKRTPWKWTVPVDDLRRLLNLTSQLSNFGDVVRRVLEPAVREINAYAPFAASYMPVRIGKATRGRGGKVTAVTFLVDRTQRGNDRGTSSCSSSSVVA